MAAQAPKGLLQSKKLWQAITKSYALRPDELRILEQACRTADWIDRLEEAQLTAPLMVRGSMGQEVISPYIASLCQHRALYAQLLGKLRLSDEDSGIDTSSAARAAAQARWSGKRGA